MESTLEKANELLAALRMHAETPWQTAIDGLFDAVNANRYFAMAKATSAKQDQLHPWGSVRGSWRDMHQYVPSFLPSELPSVVGLLKQHGKILQCGRGGGKCFVITDPSQIPTSTPVTAEQDPVSVVRNLKTTVERLVADNTELRKRNETLAAFIKEQNEALSEFRRNESVAQRLTWS